MWVMIEIRLFRPIIQANWSKAIIFALGSFHKHWILCLLVLLGALTPSDKS
jgi:hypothetical protein